MQDFIIKFMHALSIAQIERRKTNQEDVKDHS
jgi:hypothetical protein